MFFTPFCIFRVTLKFIQQWFRPYLQLQWDFSEARLEDSHPHGIYCKPGASSYLSNTPATEVSGPELSKGLIWCVIIHSYMKCVVWSLSKPNFREYTLTPRKRVVKCLSLFTVAEGPSFSTRTHTVYVYPNLMALLSDWRLDFRLLLHVSLVYFFFTGVFCSHCLFTILFYTKDSHLCKHTLDGHGVFWM